MRVLPAKSPTTNLGPFGEVIRATSSITPAIPIRWSTKYTDLESDLVYYGYRYYNPSTGRWLSRDPIGEEGGLNLYAFVKNRPVNAFDKLGLCCCGPEVAGPLDRTLLDIEGSFWRLQPLQMRSACMALHDVIGHVFGSGGGGTAWDMEPLYTWGTADLLVSFRGKCYYSSAVNYAMWGKINSICHEAATLYKWTDVDNNILNPESWSLDAAVGWAQRWKGLLGDTSERATQAYAFTSYGYNGSLSNTGTAGCSPSGQQYRGKTFSWFWAPFQGKQGP